MTIEIMNPNEIKFKSEELNTATRTIIQATVSAHEAESRSAITIAKAVADIIASVDLESEGFKSIEDFGAQLFNWKKAKTSQYKRVGEALMTGRLPETDKNGKPYSFTALAELLPMKDNAEYLKLVESTDITADTTVSNIRSAVKARKPERKTSERKEKEVSIFCMEDESEPVRVTTPTHYKDENGIPFHEWKQDGRVYMLYISGGFATVYYYSTGKVIDTTAEPVTE